MSVEQQPTPYILKLVPAKIESSPTPLKLFQSVVYQSRPTLRYNEGAPDDYRIPQDLLYPRFPNDREELQKGLRRRR